MLERLVFHEVDARSWRDLEQLFESPGGPKNCWCMVWRSLPRKSSRSDAALKKAALKQRVDEGTPVGILGYLDGEPAAWCSIAPRRTYRDLGGLDDPSEPPESVWSLVCFYVPSHLRKKRVTGRLIAAAVDHARSRGAAAIEAYPVDPDSPSYRFMGFVSSFEAAGFVEVGRAGSRRHVMRLSLVS